MRIAVISDDVLPCPPSKYGGMELLKWQWAREYAKSHEVFLFALKGSHKPGNGTLIEFQRADEVFNHLDLLRSCDIIHDSSWKLISWKLKERYGNEIPPCIWTFHGEHAPATISPPEGVQVCGVSQMQSDLLSAELQTEAITCYNGVDLSQYPLYSGERNDRLLYLNRLSEEKGIHICIDLARKHGFKLDVAGTEKLVKNPDFTARILQSMDGEKIRYWGDVGMEIKVPLLQQAKALLWPGWFKEPFGLAVVESMACGTPIIGQRIGALPEVVQEGGILIDRPSQLPEALHSIESITPDDCRRNAQRFTIEKSATSYLKLFERLIHNSSRSAFKISS